MNELRAMTGRTKDGGDGIIPLPKAVFWADARYEISCWKYLKQMTKMYKLTTYNGMRNSYNF